MSVPNLVIERLCLATNAHDLDALTACFAPDYRNDTPAHPSRGFQGRAQVRKNWEQLFAAIPDISATVSCVASNDTVWSEWEMRGTKPDGSLHLMRGVVIFGIQDDVIIWARFYLEPVDRGTEDIDVAVRNHIDTAPAEVRS